MVLVDVIDMKVRKILGPEAEGALKEMLEGELSPAVAKRVRALLRDLAADDMDMVVHDLAQLSRSISDMEQTIPDDYPASVVIYDQDDKAFVGMCDGPEPDASCPWADSDGRLPCSGLWLSKDGWQFKVANDAKDVCPLAVVLATPGDAETNGGSISTSG